MVQVREANERLVVATVHAQTMTEEAEKANRLKDEFLATVSHELRTPLNAVLGWARMLTSKQLNEERAAHAIETIERNASALAHIIDDLLDVSRIVAGTLHLVQHPVNLAGITQAAVDAVRPLATAKSIRLQFSPDPSSTEVVSGDAGRLEQVVMNLLTTPQVHPREWARRHLHQARRSRPGAGGRGYRRGDQSRLPPPRVRSLSAG